MLADIAAGTPVPLLNHGFISVQGPWSFIERINSVPGEVWEDTEHTGIQSTERSALRKSSIALKIQ